MAGKKEEYKVRKLSLPTESDRRIFDLARDGKELMIRDTIGRVRVDCYLGRKINNNSVGVVAKFFLEIEKGVKKITKSPVYKLSYSEHRILKIDSILNLESDYVIKNFKVKDTTLLSEDLAVLGCGETEIVAHLKHAVYENDTITAKVEIAKGGKQRVSNFTIRQKLRRGQNAITLNLRDGKYKRFFGVYAVDSWMVGDVFVLSRNLTHRNQGRTEVKVKLSSEVYEGTEVLVQVILENDAPSKPILQLPLNYKKKTGRHPTLKWVPSVDLNGDNVVYDVYITNKRGQRYEDGTEEVKNPFDEPGYDPAGTVQFIRQKYGYRAVPKNEFTKIATGLVMNEFTIQRSLMDFRTHKWFVVARDSQGGKVESDIFDFRTELVCEGITYEGKDYQAVLDSEGNCWLTENIQKNPSKRYRQILQEIRNIGRWGLPTYMEVVKIEQEGMLTADLATMKSIYRTGGNDVCYFHKTNLRSEMLLEEKKNRYIAFYKYHGQKFHKADKNFLARSIIYLRLLRTEY